MPLPSDALFAEDENRMQQEAGRLPSESLLDSQANRTARETRDTVRQALTVNPDKFATQRQLSGATGVPLPVVARNEERVAQEKRAADLEAVFATSPVLRRKFEDPAFAALAHDDAEGLAEIAKTIGSNSQIVTSAEFSRLVRKTMEQNPILGPDEARAMVARRVKVDNSEGGIRASQAPETTFGSLVRGVRSTVTEVLGEQVRQGLRRIGGDLLGLDTVAEDAQRAAAASQHRQFLATPQPGGLAGEIYGGIISTLHSVPGIAAAFASSGLGLGIFGVQTAAPAYSKYRDRGASVGMAALAAGLEGLAEVLGEKMPLDYFVKRFGRAGMTEFIAGLLGREMPSEIATTIAQTATDTAIANPNKTWGEWASELPADIRQTVVATLVQGGIFGGVSGLARRFELRAQEAAQAQHNAQVLGQIAQLSRASKLAQRDLSSFEAFIKDAAEEGPVQELFVDARVLAQSLPPDQLPPEVVEQLPAALASGDDVRIPLEVYAARMAPLDAGNVLLQHLKTEPGGKTQAEAQAFLQEQQTLFRQEAEKLLAEEQGNVELQSQAEQVKQHFEEQLKTANRFTSDVNTAYATLMRDFYVTMAQHLRITPVEMLQRYPLRVVAENVAGEVAMDQSTPEFQKWFEGSKVVDKQGRPLVVYHGTPAKELTEFRVPEDGYREPGIWFTPSRAYAKNYGSRGQVIPVFLRMSNPLDMRDEASRAKYLAERGEGESAIQFARRLGYDGVITSLKEYVVFDPTQIKSVNNRGTFDPNDPNILHQPLSTRVPFAKKPTEDALGETPLAIGLEEMKRDQKFFEKIVATVTQYPNYRDIKRAKTPEQKAEWFIQHVVDNLLWLHDQVPAEVRERSKLWYDGANRIANEWASRFSQEPATIAGVLAVLSPQKDWFMNVSLGERVLDIYTSKQAFRWDDAMEKTAARILAKPEYAEDLAAIRGKTLGELERTALKAMWIRVYDEAHNPREYQVVSPEGDFAGLATNADGRAAKVAWGDFGAISKAVSIIENPTPANISAQLGGMHKVRNFYNNIFDPNSARGEVTIDTHAVAAALLRPFSGNSTEVGHNFDKGPKSAALGAKGTYGLYAEAYRRAALARGLLPREMQSITWEAVRGLFTPRFKAQQKNIDAVDAVWVQFKNRRLSYEDARQQVLQLAGGIHNPEWWQPAAGAHEGTGSAADAGDVPQAGVPGGRTRSAARGAGSGDSRRAAVNTLQQGAAPSDGTRILFEVAPDPNNTELTRQWDLLPAERKFAISEQIAREVMPRVLSAVGGEGKLAIQFGGYMGATNPSFSLTLPKGTDPQVVIEATKIAGFALAQDSMMVTGPEAFPGASEVGAVTVELPGDATFEDVAAVYDQLWELELNGEKLVGGHTTVGGQMMILNYSPLDSAELAALIDQKLGGKYRVQVDPAFAWFPEKQEYDYASDRQSEEPAEVAGEPSVGAAARRLRGEASRALEAALARPDGAEEAALAQDARRLVFRAAIRLPNGEVVATEGNEVTHPQILARLERSMTPRQWRAFLARYDETDEDGNDVIGMGFVDESGKFYSRDEASELIGKTAVAEDLQDGAFNQDARGQIAFGADIKQGATISLLKNADLSTFLHETGHFFLEVLTDIARQPEAPPAVLEDVGKLFTWFGVANLAEWDQMTLEQKRPHHEQFARGFEAYLFEGKAPSLELRSLFQRFRAWLLSVYRSLTRLNVTLTDEVRGVMDRLIATDAQIKEAQDAAGYGPLFHDAAQAGMTPEQFAEYQALGAEATERAQSELQKRSLRDLKWTVNARSRAIKALQADAEEKRKAVRAEVEAEVYAEPVYAVQRFLRSGIMPDGSDATRFSDMKHKLDLDMLREQFGDGPAARWRYLSVGKYGLAGKDGLNPEIVAEMFGFSSADELISKILEAEPASSVIEGRTDQRMLERYGDLADQGAIEKAANEAIHNEARARFVATELNALTRSQTPVRAVQRAAKMHAELVLAARKIRDIRPAQHEAAEARAGKAAQAASAKGDLRTAAGEKRNQLLSHYLARGAREAIGEIDKALRYLKKFDVEGTRKNIEQEYLDQIDQLLERFEFKRVSERELHKRASLTKWIEQQREMGFEPTIDEDTLAEARRQNYRTLSLEEFRGLVDAVKNIEHLGRLKKKLLTARDEREFAQRVDEAVRSIEENATRIVPERRSSERGALVAIGALARSFAAEHRKFASIIREMDGFKDAGVLWDLFVRSMNDRGNFEAVEREKATVKLAALLKPVVKDLGRKVYIEKVGKSFTREELLGIALNMGNAGNIERVMTGERWTQEQLSAVLDPLSKEDWDFVQSVLDYLESFRPQIAAKQKRVTGIEPEWVEATPIVTKHGIYRGGYYPIKSDPQLSSKAEADSAAEVQRQMERGLYVQATTRRGHVKSRVESTGRVMRYDLGVITQHVDQVIHDLAWHEWLIDANRLLRNKALDQAIRRHYGPEKLKQLKDTLRDIAIGELPAQESWERIVKHIRHGATIVGLGWNVATSLMQPLGLTQSMVRIGPKWVAKGLAKWLGSPARMNRVIEEVYAKSDFMRLRGKTMQREINEIRNQVSGRNSALEASYFMLIQKAQIIADVPTWLGAFEKAMANPKTADEATAVALADQAVIDSQGGGQTKDLAAVQRGNEFKKLWTNFYSFFSTTYNLAVEKTKDTNFKSPSDVAALAVSYVMLFSVPAVLGSLMKSLLAGDDPDEMVKKLGREQLNYMLGTMIGMRELGAAVQGFQGYSGPAGTRIFSELAKLTKQVEQGEIDEAFIRAAAGTAGVIFHLPTAAVVRLLDGIHAIVTGKTSNPGALAAGSREN